MKRQTKTLSVLGLSYQGDLDNLKIIIRRELTGGLPEHTQKLMVVSQELLFTCIELNAEDHKQTKHVGIIPCPADQQPAKQDQLIGQEKSKHRATIERKKLPPTL